MSLTPEERLEMVREFLETQHEVYKDWDADGLAAALAQLLYDSRPPTEREREVGRRLIAEAAREAEPND